MSNSNDTFPFQSSKEEIIESHSRKKQLPKYLAFLDEEFMLRRELRPYRLSLEFLKAEMRQLEEGIASTIVVFGSARIAAAEDADKMLSEAAVALANDPENVTLQRNVSIAKREVKKSFYYEQSRKFAQIVSVACQTSSKNEFVIVTGGGPGIMEAANRGAHEVQSKSIGLNIFLPREQGMNPYITPELNLQFHYFAIRKMHFLIRSRALIFFPGGYGTLDELFEALTLMQTHKIRKIPVLLFGKEYWSKVVNFDYLIEEGAIDAEDADLFKYVETAEEAWARIAEFYKVDTQTCKPVI